MTRPRKPIKCGISRHGAAQHRKRGEDPCELCLKMERLAMREYRSGERFRQRDKEAQKARDYALRDLGHLYPDEYRRLYTQHLGEIRRQRQQEDAA